MQEFLNEPTSLTLLECFIAENDWMETVDLSTLLETSGPVVEETKPAKSGRLLEELLTNPIKIKSSPTVSESLQLDTFNSESSSSLNEQLNEQNTHVTDIISFGTSDDGVDALLLQQQLQELYEAAVSTSDMDTCDNTSGEISLISESTEESLLESSNEFIGSPLSSEDIDSILSGSGPSSPSDSIENDPDYRPSIEKSSKKSKKSRTSKTSSSNSKSRPTPYEKPVVEKIDKKERKRIQNRNAAIRYREKKRAQKGSIHTEEEDLAIRNKELKTKVEHLNNEIKYMKNLLVEVCQARGLKIEFK